MTYSALDFVKEAQAPAMAMQPQQQQQPSAAKKWAKRGVMAAGATGGLLAANKLRTGDVMKHLKTHNRMATTRGDSLGARAKTLGRAVSKSWKKGKALQMPWSK